MTRVINKNAIAGAVAMMVLTILASYLWHQPVLMFVPAALVMVILIMQRPSRLILLLAFLIPWSFEIPLGNFSTDVPDEPLMWVASLVALDLWIRKRKAGVHSHAIVLLALAQLAWAAVCSLQSVEPLFSLKYMAAKSWYLLCFLVLPLLLPNITRLMKHAAVVLTISASCTAVWMLVRHAMVGFSFDDVNTAVSPFYRNHVMFAAMIVLCLPLAYAAWRLALQGRWKKLAFAALVILCLALIFSYSRGAWLALLAALPAGWLLRRQWLLKGLLLVIVIVVGAFAWLAYENRYLRFAPDYRTTIYHEALADHMQATYKLQDVSTAERFYRWIAGIRMAPDNILTGTGPSTFTVEYKKYTVPLYRTWVSRNEERSTVHNYFLLLLVEQGLPGLLLFLVFIGAVVWQLQQLRKKAESKEHKLVVEVMAAMLVMILLLNFLSDLVETDKVGSVFYWVAAMTVILSRKKVIS